MLSGVTGIGFSANRVIAAVGGGRIAVPAGKAQAADGQAVERNEPVTLGKSELTEAEKAEVERLRQRDAEVRQHEQSHKAAAGQYARGGPNYEYEIGPDGKSYAVSGRVEIDTSPVPNNPQATIAKMQQIRQAAMAVADPSSADQQVAAKAAAVEQEARAELAQQQARGTKEGIDASSTGPTSGSGLMSAPAPGWLSGLVQSQQAVGRFINVLA